MFDVKKAIGLPEIRNIVNKRDEVIEYFGPLFRNSAQLTKETYYEFLSMKKNHHWSGLERLGKPAADNMENLRSAVSILVDEDQSLPSRYDAAAGMLPGVGAATLTPILLLVFPKRYGVWNTTSESEMKKKGVWPAFPIRASMGEKYELINSVLNKLASEHKVDLWTLDALWWMSRMDEKVTGHYKDEWGKAIWGMATQAEQTAKQSNGQTVETKKNNRELRVSKEKLIELLDGLLKQSDYQCAITDLPLQPDGPDDQLRPSLDRIDSNGHYEIGNLQVVARFINFWKSNTEDAEFRRLIDIVRRE